MNGNFTFSGFIMKDHGIIISRDPSGLQREAQRRGFKLNQRTAIFNATLTRTHLLIAGCGQLRIDELCEILRSARNLQLNA
jgi:hypothetical protein